MMVGEAQLVSSPRRFDATGSFYMRRHDPVLCFRMRASTPWRRFMPSTTCHSASLANSGSSAGARVTARSAPHVSTAASCHTTAPSGWRARVPRISGSRNFKLSYALVPNLTRAISGFDDRKSAIPPTNSALCQRREMSARDGCALPMRQHVATGRQVPPLVSVSTAKAFLRRA
jgi:hypothetical protein